MQNQLTQQKTADLATLPPETVWLANFISPQTKKTYKNAVKQFLSFAGIEDSEQLHTVTSAHLIAWREQLSNTGASPRTINNKISALSSLYKFLCQEQITKINPADSVKRLRVNQNKVETPVLTPQQVRTLLDCTHGETLKDIRDRAILHTLFYTGCRVAEVTTLQVKNLLEDNGYLVIDFTVKGGKKNRIAIHQELQITLRNYLTKQGHEQDRQSPLFLPVKPEGSRKKLSSRQINNIFHATRKKAGLPPTLSPHSARATLITNALENNCPIEAVQKSVGHANITTTQAYDKRESHYRESASFKVCY